MAEFLSVRVFVRGQPELARIQEVVKCIHLSCGLDLNRLIGFASAC